MEKSGAIKVLLIDNNANDADLLRGMLLEVNASDYDIRHATTLSGGLECLAEGGFELVLLDLCLPDSSGIESFTKIQCIYKTIPIIVTAGHHDEETALKTLQEGAQDYIVKGHINAKALSRIICYSLERHRLLLELEVTLRKLKQTQGQLLQSEKMASIGQLAAGVAHEINNPVGFINSNISTLGEYIEDMIEIVKKYDEGLARIASNDAKAAEVRKEIDSFKEELDYDFIVEDIKNVISETRDGTERVATIVQDLKEFSHVDRKEEKTYTDINHWLDTTLNLVWNELKYNVELKKEYGEIPEVECYPHQLSQVFMNLLVNASQAIEDNGEIGIRTYTEEDRVFIKISDTGKGMSKELMNRIFEPFYTTKPVGKGTGLGLSVSYGIIEKHQGSLKVESEEGKGTTFTVEIPVNSIADEGDDHGDPTVLPG